MKYLKGKKAYIIAGLMVLTALVKLLVGDISLVEFLTGNDLWLLLEGLGLGALRAGVAKMK